MVNSHEIRIFGLQRSGIHALVNWIVQQSAGPTVFINDIKSLTANPYMRRDIHLQRTNESAPPPLDVKSELEGNHLPKEYLILGYEDTDLRQVPVGFDELIREAVGSSETVTNLLILRDPYNLCASRMRFFNSANRNPMRTRSDYVLGLWKMHAREALRHTLYLGPNTLVVKYNEWFSSPAYRKHIADSTSDPGASSTGVLMEPNTTAMPTQKMSVFSHLQEQCCVTSMPTI